MTVVPLGLVQPPAERTPNVLDANGSKSKSSWNPLRRPASTPSRLIIDVERVVCCFCSRPEVISEDVIATVPEACSQRGISQKEWSHWMGRFRDTVATRSISVMSVVCCAFSIIGIPVIIYRHNKLQRSVAKFVREFNSQVLEPRQMYFKVQKGPPLLSLLVSLLRCLAGYR
jgi:hypothetical protein